MRSLYLSLAALTLAAFVPAQNKTLLTVSRYNSESLDAKAGLLGKLRPFDILTVTPAAGATAAPWIPGAAISAAIGDPDNDGLYTEFAGLPHASFGIGGLFIKHADRKKGDPRLVYWGVRVPITNPPKIEVFDKANNKLHTVVPGDFLRFKENGDVEFFIRQQHIMDAAGTQKGNWVRGAGDICQTAAGDIYYSPPHAISQSGGVAGGHWIAGKWCNDGAIGLIPASAITYDSNGNVQSVKKGSASKVLREGGAGPKNEVSVRTMCGNSGALDAIGAQTKTTFMMVGLDLDPNGGVFDGWDGNKHPNLIYTFENSPFGSTQGSWMGTVFSTAKGKSGQFGTVAVINGTSMGVTTGKATGAWTGIKQGTGSANAPLIRGLAWMEAGLKSTAPYGTAVLQVEGDGRVQPSTTSKQVLAFQGPSIAAPWTLWVGFPPKKGSPPTKVFDLSSLAKGYASAYVFESVAFLFPQGGSGINGQAFLSLTVNNSMIGLQIICQATTLIPSPKTDLMTNPVILDIR